jgi:phosphoesterase RecJ-like protein
MAVVYMREVREGVFRVSLRSKGEIDVSGIAEAHGGGGHKNAAGCKVEGDWDELENLLMEELSLAVSKAERALDESVAPNAETPFA